jgi:uncharacterized protein (DUF2235 family)
MPKNIVICLDGTGNEFGHQNSNVILLYKMLTRGDAQIAYYHPGVGTMGARSALSHLGKWWTRMIGLAFGYGISDNLADAYQFLMRVYQPDDRIYVFGFSRGAYTARALTGMLHLAGLLTPGNEALIPYAIRMLKRRRIEFDVLADFKKTFSRPCQIRFAGVWDTVSTVGWIYNAVKFPSTAKNPDIDTIRHAVSIDERRAFFRQNLFAEGDGEQDVEQVWFAGVHSDVGGSYPEAESGLSKIALRWMAGEAERAGLAIDPRRKAELLGGRPPYVAPDPAAPMHQSLHGIWWLAEIWPKIVHTPQPGGQWRRSLRVNLGRPRALPENSLLHISVAERIAARADYRPKNLHVEEPLERHFRIARDRC